MTTESQALPVDAGPSRPPRVWLLVGDKLGDNAQVRMIARALDWPVEEKYLRMRPDFEFGKPRVKASLHHIDGAASAPLEPPWPDLVIAIGRRMSMAALWIKERSGGRSRIVLVGRPRRLLERFDLVVTATHYRLPPRPNVMRLDLPLMAVDPAAVEAAATEWGPRLTGLRRPLVALLVGGPTKPVRFDPDVAGDLLDRSLEFVRGLGGTLFVSTSRRTPAAIADLLEHRLPVDARLYRWRPDSADNPYLGLLGLADGFIVTGDSISMMVEVARLGKPLAIFRQPPSERPASRLLRPLGRLLHGEAGPLRRLGDLLYRTGLTGYSRDLEALHDLLFTRGLAVPLGAPFPATPRRAADEAAAVAARIKTLLAPAKDPGAAHCTGPRQGL